MIPAVQIELPQSTRNALVRVAQWPRALTTAVVRELNLQNELTVGHIVEKRATGAGPFPVSEGKLGVRSSRYRRSVRPAKAALVGTEIQSAIGSNARYAGVHEFGFTGVVSVKSHRARNRATDVFQVRDGRLVKGWELAGAGGRGKRVASGYVQVKAHQVRMNMPARAPIRRGIEDRIPLYGPALGAAIVAALDKPSA